MDAIEFLKEKDRMCKAYNKNNCEGCPFEENEQGIHHTLCAFKLDMLEPDEYVLTVQDWSENHPVLTNRMKLKEVFGINSPLLIADSFWDLPYKEP